MAHECGRRPHPLRRVNGAIAPRPHGNTPGIGYLSRSRVCGTRGTAMWSGRGPGERGGGQPDPSQPPPAAGACVVGLDAPALAERFGLRRVILAGVVAAAAGVVVIGLGVDVAASRGVLMLLAFATFLSFMTIGRIVGTGLLDRYGRVPSCGSASPSRSPARCSSSSVARPSPSSVPPSGGSGPPSASRWA